MIGVRLTCAPSDTSTKYTFVGEDFARSAGSHGALGCAAPWWDKGGAESAVSPVCCSLGSIMALGLWYTSGPRERNVCRR